MGFLAELMAKRKAEAPKLSVIEEIKQNLGGYRKQRSHEVVHASDVTAEDFCPRQWALWDELGKQKPKRFIPIALEATYDVGEATAQLVREKWLGDSSIGNWLCLRCGGRRKFTSRPDDHDDLPCPKHHWRYEEVKFTIDEWGIELNIDVMARLGGLKVYPIECKIMAPAQFDSLVGPLAEHRVRTNLYLNGIHRSDSPYKQFINTEQSFVLYVSRGHGKKNTQQEDKILPFKEYPIERTWDDEVKMAVRRAQAVKRFREDQVFPRGVCGSHANPMAKRCNVSKDCFSGTYPMGAEW